jgi:hypothetical protein
MFARHLSLALPGLPVVSVAIHRLSSVRGEPQAAQPLWSDIATPVYAQYGSNERGVCNRRLIEKERHGCERLIEYRIEVRITFTSATGPGSECRPV